MTSTIVPIVVVLALWAGAWQLGSLRGRQLLLLLASYVFYWWFGGTMLAMLVASSRVAAADGHHGRAHAAAPSPDAGPEALYARSVLLDGLADPTATAEAVRRWTADPGVRPEGPDVELPVTFDGPDLEDVAATCASLNRWKFQLVIAPLVLTGGTGSPVNPIACF